MLLPVEYRGVDYAAAPGLCSKHMPVLGFGEGAKREIDEEGETEEEEDSYLSRGVSRPLSPDCLGDLPAPPGSSRPSSLVYCPVMTLSTATMRPLIARCRPPQWLNGGVMERRIRPVVILKSSEALSYLAACASER